jgi:hypothetical protein
MTLKGETMPEILRFLLVPLLAVIVLCASSLPAQALQYVTCQAPSESSACLIAFEVLKTKENPITGERFFQNGYHIRDGETVNFPKLYLATPDINDDKTPEIFVIIPEDNDALRGTICRANNQCPHFIIQDRALPGEKRTVNTYRAIGPIYSYAVALSTDESFDNFRSLRAYKDGTWQRFDVYQYDSATDQYYNMSAAP